MMILSMVESLYLSVVDGALLCVRNKCVVHQQEEGMLVE